MGGDPDTALLVVGTALRDLNDLIGRAERARGSGDAVGLGRVLHSLRGAASTLGATSFGDNLQAWEQSIAHSGEVAALPWEGLLELCDKYRSALEELEAAIAGRRPI